MLYSGLAFRLESLPDSILKISFDLKTQSANILNAMAIKELRDVLDIIRKQSGTSGLLLTSAKSNGFVLGADVTEFIDQFKKPETEIKTWIDNTNLIFNGFEDLPFPKVALVNGFALGGGCEFALMMDYRLGSPQAVLGLPETSLGIIPAWGGTVRLTRLIGAENAIEWITGAKYKTAQEALRAGALDEIVEENNLEEAGLKLLKKCINDQMDWEGRVKLKKSPVNLSQIELTTTIERSKKLLTEELSPDNSAPLSALESIQQSAHMSRDEALVIEGKTFSHCAKTKTAEHLVQVFLKNLHTKN